MSGEQSAVPVTSEPDDWGWLSATHVRPPDGQLVLVWFANGEIRVGHWNERVKRWCPPRADRFLRVQPTHWQPLPAGPAGATPVLTPTHSD